MDESSDEHMNYLSVPGGVWSDSRGFSHRYSYGERVSGSFHSWFRVAGLQDSECLQVSRMIRGLEKTGSVSSKLKA